MYGYYAMSYLNQWLKNDSRWYGSINSSDSRSKQLQAIKEAATHYRVARNWRSVSEEGERYGPILDFLLHCGPIPAGDVASYVTRAAEDLKKINEDRNVLSMTSKLLWIKFRSPIVIYDKQAKEALGVRGGDYSIFLKAWRDKFSEEKEMIASACRSLENGITFCVNPDLGLENLKALTSSDFFMERVFDMKLWTVGGRTQ